MKMGRDVRDEKPSLTPANYHSKRNTGRRGRFLSASGPGGLGPPGKHSRLVGARGGERLSSTPKRPCLPRRTDSSSPQEKGDHGGRLERQHAAACVLLLVPCWRYFATHPALAPAPRRG